ncbi:hypothetical protein DFH06DRAFT_1361668 [Mycena polygramma]|nr:hypothetical protein DFH06DRAFT_1361662 [Mycena polygramma]KAJ7619004.1 hypothetical protein DFH06DRAFT_1361668 [Mycena polygramma]
MPHLSSLHLTSSRDSYTPKPSHSTFSARLDVRQNKTKNGILLPSLFQKPKIPGYRVLAVAPCNASAMASPALLAPTTRHARLRDRSSDDVLTCTSHYTDPSTPSIHTSTHDTRSPAAESRANPLSPCAAPVTRRFARPIPPLPSILLVPHTHAHTLTHGAAATHLPVPPPTPESELCNGLQRPADLLKHKRDKREGTREMEVRTFAYRSSFSALPPASPFSPPLCIDRSRGLHITPACLPSIRTRPTAARRAEYAKDPHPAQDSSLHADSARPQDAASAPDVLGDEGATRCTRCDRARSNQLHARLACHTSRTPCRYIASCELRVSPTRSATAPCSPTGSSCRSRPALAARESSASPPIRDPYARRSLSRSTIPGPANPARPARCAPRTRESRRGGVVHARAGLCSYLTTSLLIYPNAPRTYF